MKELLYLKIFNSIREDIEKGTLPEESRLDGVRELAKHWDTSPNTVLKALDELEARGYIRKTRGQGIFVKQLKKLSGSGQDVRMLDLVLYDLDVPFNRMLVAAVEKAAADFGFTITVKTKPSSGMLPGDSPAIFVPAAAPDFYSPDLNLSAGNGRAVPVIYTGEFNPPGDFPFSYAVADTYGGFYRAAEILLAGKRERIAYIGASDDLKKEAGWNACRDVLAGSRAGFNREYAVSARGWDADKGREAMEKILLNGEFPDGLVCCNDNLAAGALKACRLAGLAVPDDIAVIGAGDGELASLLSPPLTSLKLPALSLGFTAVSYIDAVLSGRVSEPFRMRLDMELVVRESSSSSDDTEDVAGLNGAGIWL